MAMRDHVLSISIFVGLAAVLSVVRATTHPSLNRPWRPDQATLATIEIHGNDVDVRNIRNIDYRAPEDYTPTYYDRSFRLQDLERAWLFVEFLGAGRAHLMLSFQFKGPAWVVFSPEPRLERDESFFAPLGLFRRYELAYIVADEMDAVRRRTNTLNHNVTLYELQVSGEKLANLFIDMAGRAAKLSREPEFYHTIFNSNTRNVMKHVKKASSRRVTGPLLFATKVPKRLYDMRLLRRDLPFEFLRGRGRITETAQKNEPGADFSSDIRSAVSRFTEGL